MPISVYSALPVVAFQPKLSVFVNFHSEPPSFLAFAESEETLFHKIAPVLRAFGILLSVIAFPEASVIVAVPFAIFTVYEPPAV